MRRHDPIVERNHLGLLGAMLAVAILPGCAIAPASLSRVVAVQKRADLHALLSKSLEAPDTPEGKRALGHFIEEWKEDDRGARDVLPAVAGQQTVTYDVSFGDAWCDAYPLHYFDEIRPASDFKVRKIRHHTREGVGVPLMAIRENEGREAIEKYFPPEVISRPLTAVAWKGPLKDGRQEVRVDLLCPMANDTILMGGKPEPLAADFSVPWAASLARAGKLNQSKVLDMITPEPRREPQLYLMEPYDPRKEPLIMIHGLLSTPLAWADLSNELWADEEVRRRYQIWHFLYNTSAPALYSARLLRTQLRDLRKVLDPGNDDPAMRRTTLLTHSMGGLVGKALVMEPKDVFWKAAFTVPHQQLVLSREDREMLTDAFEWKADPTVHRIIFIAVPHRGSDFADNFVGRVGSWLTKPPSRFQAFYQRVSAANPGVFTPEYAMLGSGRLDSVHSLSPRQPTLKYLNEIPYAHPVTIHSIIGNRGRSGELLDSSDGIVPYTSSHLEGVASELVVPSGHGAFKHPEAITEVKRILKL